MARDFPDIRVGCELLQINGLEVRDSFKVVRDNMPNPKDPWAPPLRLWFSVPKKRDLPWPTKKWPTLPELSWPEHSSSPRLSCTPALQRFREFEEVAGRAEVPVWVVAGLDGVAIVQKHENARMERMQKLREDRDDEAQTMQLALLTKISSTLYGRRGLQLEKSDHL